jgi:amino acid transporter
VKKEKFYIAVCVVSFCGIWAVKLNLRVFTYFDWWFVVGLVIIFCFAIWYLNNKNGKNKNNKAA